MPEPTPITNHACFLTRGVPDFQGFADAMLDLVDEGADGGNAIQVEAQRFGLLWLFIKLTATNHDDIVIQIGTATRGMLKERFLELGDLRKISNELEYLRNAHDRPS